MYTSRVLTKMGLHHTIVVEPHEVELYEQAVKDRKILADIVELDMSYKDKYELCDQYGSSRPTGGGPARNFIWDHSIKSGAKWHWIMDDNIRKFYRLNKNVNIQTESPGIWKAMEDFVLRYENVAIAGPQYFMFIPRKTKLPPFAINCRVYSCLLIRNDVPFRWRGRYNEDTILSLDVLKAGYATILFNAFSQLKMPTQSLPGGCTDEFYLVEGEKQEGEKYSDKGTLAKSLMLAEVHPDVASITYRFSRIHHHVDYQPFKNRKLIRKSNLKISETNEYGMKLKQY